jgi:hypothetical protein
MPNACVYKNESYSDGAVVCMNGYEYRREDGTWEPLGTTCDAGDGVELTPKEDTRKNLGNGSISP